jgi:hypothetical protein
MTTVSFACWSWSCSPLCFGDGVVDDEGTTLSTTCTAQQGHFRTPWESFVRDLWSMTPGSEETLRSRRQYRLDTTDNDKQDAVAKDLVRISVPCLAASLRGPGFADNAAASPTRRRAATS